MELLSFFKQVLPKPVILAAKKIARCYNYTSTKKYFTGDISNIRFLEFHLTGRCNYKCEYCMGSYSPKSRNASDETVNNFIKLTAELSEGCTIKLIGGEPTFHPRFFEIADAVIKNGHNLHVGTNFSPSNDLFIKLINRAKHKNQIHLLISLHLSQIESVESFLEKAITLREYGKEKLFLQVSSVVTEENIVLLKEINENLSRFNIPVMFQRLKINSKTGFYQYNDETEKYLEENFPDRIGKKIEGLDTFGLLCQTGCRFVRISLDGEVNRCYNFQAKLYGLGNINTSWKPLKDTMPCLSRRCTCLLPVAWELLEFGNYNKDLADKIKRNQ